MKKLMIVAAAMAFAAVAQAASVSWSLEKDDAKTYGGLTAYVIDGSSYSDVIAILTTGGDSMVTDFNAKVLQSVALNSRGAGSSNTPGVTSDSIAFFIFKNDEIKAGGAYDTTGVLDASAYVYDPPSNAPGTLPMTVETFSLKNQTIAGGGDTPAEPEPTSALLMLCGLAGLALRRKCA